MNQHRLPSDVIGLSKVMPPLSRRGFMTTSAAAAAGYTLAAGPVRADAIKTDTNGLTVGDAKVEVAGGDMPVYFAKPANVANPPVILVAMEIFGVHEYIKRRDPAARPSRRASRSRPTIISAQRRRPHQDRRHPEAVPDRQRQARHANCSRISTPRSTGRSRRAATPTGSASWASAAAGATVWLYSTHNPDLKAGVAFYGTLADPKNDVWPKNSISLAAEVKEPVLGLYGAEDTGIKVDQVKDMEAALKAAGKTAEFHIYPGAPHGFHADYRPSYREEAAEDAWNKMIAWFKKYSVLS